MNTTARTATWIAARTVGAAALTGSAFVAYFGLELRLPESAVAPLGLGDTATSAVAALAVPVALGAAAVVLVVQLLLTPGLVPAATRLAVRTARARWAQRLMAVALVLGAPVVYLALVMPSILGPLSTVELVTAVAAPVAMLLAALTLTVLSCRPRGVRGAVLAA